MRRIVGLGAGGHARVVIDILRLRGGWDEIVLLDRESSLGGQVVDGAEIVGDDALLEALVESGVRDAFIGLGSSPNIAPRRSLYLLARDSGLTVVDALHPSAIVASTAALGTGVTLCANSVVGPGARVGENVLVNTAAVVEHDCSVGDHVHVASGAVLGGGVSVGSGTHVGLGACVLPGVQIGSDVIVAAGAVVVDDTEDGIMVAGIPARILGSGA